MDSKGFTFIELIVAVGLLALLGVLIGTNMVGLQSKQMAKNYEGYKQQIADAACTYIESKSIIIYTNYSSSNTLNNSASTKQECLSNSGYCYVYTGDLITSGYLSEDLENPATANPVTDSEIVKISFVKGVKTCEYYSS